MFGILCNLSDRFPALSPFSLRRERLTEVVSIYADTAHFAVIQRLTKANGGVRPPEGSFMIGNTLYKPATDDDWY
jgi:hypothetical protein